MTRPGLNSGLCPVGAPDFPGLDTTEANMRKTGTTSTANAVTIEPFVPMTNPSMNRRSSRVHATKSNDKTKPSARDRTPSKSEQVLQLLRRNRGASLAELQELTGWRADSVRGFLSGTVNRRLGLTLVSEAFEKSGRCYRIVEA